jgi:hypothetical protein
MVPYPGKRAGSGPYKHNHVHPLMKDTEDHECNGRRLMDVMVFIGTWGMVKSCLVDSS